jgi:Mn2+/Fe2+ NRAMP family transporter
MKRNLTSAKAPVRAWFSLLALVASFCWQLVAVTLAQDQRQHRMRPPILLLAAHLPVAVAGMAMDMAMGTAMAARRQP